MLSNTSFTRDNLDMYLKELAKEFKKMNGNHMPAEIILIGGASILINYGFRDMTYDMDAIINASSSMKDAINHVSDKYDLPNGWLKDDFMNTKSYTPKLIEYSRYYKTFSNIVKVRTVTESYLVAMKLMAGRQYKNDLSDVVGIILEQEKANSPLSLNLIKNATIELYGDYYLLPENSRRFIEMVFECSDLQKFFDECRQNEQQNKDVLLEFHSKYPNVINENNLEDILRVAKAKRDVEKGNTGL